MLCIVWIFARVVKFFKSLSVRILKFKSRDFGISCNFLLTAPTACQCLGVKPVMAKERFAWMLWRGDDVRAAATILVPLPR